MSSLNYRRLWDELIAAIVWEIVDIDKLPSKAKTVEDVWVEATLCNVLKKMCALHKLPPEARQTQELTRPLFE